MNLEEILAVAEAALERQGASLTSSPPDRVAVRIAGTGPGRPIDIPLGPLREWLAGEPERGRQGVVSFFRGVGSVVVAPPLTRREAGLSFAELAGRLVPSLEGPLFPLGAKLASGEEIVVEPAFGGLSVAHFVEFDRGRRLLTRQKLDAWGVSQERAHKAGLSLVFYRTYEVPPAPFEPDALPGCEAFQIKDGYDATRVLVLDSLFFGRCRAGLLAGVPASDLLLLLDASADGSTRAAFRRRIEALFAESAWSLSDRVYEVREDRTSELVDS